MTAGVLRRYDRGIGDVRVLASGERQSYCIESTLGAETASYRGPGGDEVGSGGC